MKKLIQSAFAMSLIILPFGTFGADLVDLSEFEAEILPELVGTQRFTTESLHVQQPDWQVKANDVVMDKEPLKGQTFSLIPWKTQNPEEWLSVNQWLVENEIKTKNPDWMIRLRDDNQLELMGKVLSCKGRCPIYRGTMPADGQFLSRLVEGDEIRTDKDSEAWIFLIDGTLVRLGADSSLSLQEINFSRSEIFILARLNRGHVFWHPRPKGQHPLEYAPETAALSLPLHVLDANVQHFERQIFKAQNDRQQLSEVMDLDDNAIKAQITKLNELRTEHDKLLSIPTHTMLVAPNVTLVSTQLSFDFVYTPGGNSYFKKRGNADTEMSLHLRGYTEMETKTVQENDWFEINPQGKTYTRMEAAPGMLNLMELLTKRMKTLELAREIWIKSFTLPVIAAMVDPKVFAIEQGYSLWGEESKKRFEYLSEYNRRIETTNIRSIENLLTKIQESGQKVNREIRPEMYEHALNNYLKGLKTKYNQKRMQVREMSDLQYYAWTLKNGTL